MPRFQWLEMSVEELAVLGQNPEAQRGLQILVGFEPTALPPASQPVSTPEQLLPPVHPGQYLPQAPAPEIDLGAFDAEVEAICTVAPATVPAKRQGRKAGSAIASLIAPSLWLLLRMLHPKRLPWVVLTLGLMFLAAYLLAPVESIVEEVEPTYRQSSVEPEPTPNPEPSDEECSSAFPCDLPQ